MDISIVIPLYNEDESLPELIAWIGRVVNSHNFSYEIVLVDDGSKDRSWELIETNAKRNAIMENQPHYIADFKQRKAMLSSLWMPTCRIVRMKSLLFTI